MQKKIVSVLLALFCIITLGVVQFPAKAVEKQYDYVDIINISKTSQGYCTVTYNSTNSKMKVKIEHEKGKYIYYNYTSGKSSRFTFTEGNGIYTITLFQNITGTSYKKITEVKTKVKLKNKLVPYLVSTDEITFTKTDSVGKQAKKICAKAKTDSAKATAIKKYMTKNFKYDYSLAKKVKNGSVTNYTPNTRQILKNKKGICYDLSALYAAMCRSQGIPCKIETGYTNSGEYHAWNRVYVNGKWVKVDITASLGK